MGLKLGLRWYLNWLCMHSESFFFYLTQTSKWHYDSFNCACMKHSESLFFYLTQTSKWHYDSFNCACMKYSVIIFWLAFFSEYFLILFTSIQMQNWVYCLSLIFWNVINITEQKLHCNSTHVILHHNKDHSYLNRNCSAMALMWSCYYYYYYYYKYVILYVYIYIRPVPD